jgi:hypothetical protein
LNPWQLSSALTQQGGCPASVLPHYPGYQARALATCCAVSNSTDSTVVTSTSSLGGRLHHNVLKVLVSAKAFPYLYQRRCCSAQQWSGDDGLRCSLARSGSHAGTCWFATQHTVSTSMPRPVAGVCVGAAYADLLIDARKQQQQQQLHPFPQMHQHPSSSEQCRISRAITAAAAAAAQWGCQ